MLRSMLYRNYLPASVWIAATRKDASSAALSSQDSFKALVESLTRENEISPVKRTNSLFVGVSSIGALKKLVSENKRKLSSDYSALLRTAISLFKDKASARNFIRSCINSSSEIDIANMVIDDDFIGLITTLLEIGLKDEQILCALKKKLENNIGEADFSISAVVPFLIVSKRADCIWSEEVRSVLQEVLTSQIRDIDRADLIIAILTHWDPDDKIVLRAAAQRTIQLLESDLSCCALTVGEMCSLMNKYSERGLRDKKLLSLLSARITSHQTTLSVKQLVSLSASCSKLNYYDARVLRRIAKDLPVDINNISSWNDISCLVDSFSRIRFGDVVVWNVLARWVNNHIDDVPLETLSIVISGMARNGVEECRPAALALSQRVRRESATSQNAWLSTVYSLAFFRALSPLLVESVLNKDFVLQLLQSSTSPSDRLYKTLKLMQINACAETDFGSSYAGPRLEMSDLEPFIKFDDDTVRIARLIKYGKKELDLCNNFLSEVVFKMGSPSTHISPSCIDKDGVLVDARILCEEGSTRLIPIKKWGQSIPRPIIFYGWGQTRQVSNDIVRTEENVLLGWDQLSLRLLRARGIKPIVVLHSELGAMSSTADKLQFLRRRILDSA